MITERKVCISRFVLPLLAVLSGVAAQGSVIAVGPGAFPGSATSIMFTNVPMATEVNGLSTGGATFSYSLGNGNVQIDGGPGTTNNITPPNIVSIGDDSGILRVNLPGLENLFGYGYALLAQSTVTNATTVTLFNGATNVGSLSFTGAIDPLFAGGFAGIQSTLAFNSVALTFNSTAAPAFAVDNILFAPTASAVPEPSMTLLFLAGSAGLLWRFRSMRHSRS